jgi:tetratricopeptide (TPR) repeat protein
MSEAAFVELACLDLVERLVALSSIDQLVGPQSVGSDFHSAFVKLAARRLAHGLLGRELLPRDEEESTWTAMREVLSRSEPGCAVLRELGEQFECASAHDQNSTEDSVIRLPMPADFPANIGGELTLRKTRRRSAFTIDDFSAIDALSKIPREDLVRLWRILCRSSPPANEPAACLIAITAYALGRFDDSVAALLRCLEFDLDVEEYWHLLAFVLRHLARYREFDEIMFGNRREASLLRDLASYEALLERMNDELPERMENPAE